MLPAVFRSNTKLSFLNFAKIEQFQSSVHYHLTALSWVLRIQAQQALIVPGLYKEAQADILSPAAVPRIP